MGVSQVLAGNTAAVRCPFPHYRETQEAAGVYHDAETDVYVVSDPALIFKVANEPAIFSSRNPQGPQVFKAIDDAREILEKSEPELFRKFEVMLSRGAVLFTADPPDHARHRRMFIKALSRGAVLQAQPTVRAICTELIDGFIGDGEVELMSAYATPVPVLALATFLGVGPERALDFGRWAKALNAANGHSMDEEELRENIATQLEFLEFLEAEIERRREAPGDDLLSMMLEVGRDESEIPLTVDEMLALGTQFVAAGADTTSNLIGSGTYQLVSDPELMKEVRSDSALIRPFVEESLRLESPVQGLHRVTTEETELGGVHIPADRYVYLLYAAANRDPDMFDEPDSYRLDRSGAAHFGFGRGPHTCLGAQLARTVASIAFEVLLSRLTDLQLTEPDNQNDINVDTYVLRGPRTLPLSFKPPQ